jgi:glyoxylase-like metal-dependent hydrolase (beta-lactamase superfamily II)
MFFRQVRYRDLGCASYLLGDAGEAVVVDPRWDIDVYLEIARPEGLRIAHVIDTPDHADHVSGRLRLATATW